MIFATVTFVFTVGPALFKLSVAVLALVAVLVAAAFYCYGRVYFESERYARFDTYKNTEGYMFWHTR